MYSDEQIPLNNNNYGAQTKNHGQAFEDGFEGFSANLYIRNGFVKKVYLILSTQLCLTAACIIVGIYTPSVQTFIRANYWIQIVALVINIVTMIVLMCIPKVARSVPINYILLLIFTLCEAFLATSVCIHYPKNLVFTAAILTSALVIGLTLYAMYTDTDFTMMGGILFAGSLVLLAASFIAAFIQIKILNLVISVFSVLLFGVYLIYDTQLVIGGERRKMEIGIDDYIMGALILYIDIITIFIQILQILGQASNKQQLIRRTVHHQLQSPQFLAKSHSYMFQQQVLSNKQRLK